MSEYIYEHGRCHDHFGKPLNAPMLTQREEIVRCRDCKYYYDVDDLDDAQCHWFTDCYDQPVYWAEPDGFCKWGKRKENTNEEGNQC